MGTANHVCNSGCNWRHNHHSFCVRVALFTRQCVNSYAYASGIGILTLTLVLFGFLGRIPISSTFGHLYLLREPFVPEWDRDGKPTLSYPKQICVITSIKEHEKLTMARIMFYLHFVGLTMLLPLLPDLVAQMEHHGSRTDFSFPLPTLAFASVLFF